MQTYLPDDILVKVDRASMRVGLEARVPLLDHRVVEFAWSLPPQMNRRHTEGKWPLCQILYKHVPQALFDRPKKGFSVPLKQWLQGPLRDWAESLLDEHKLAQQGYLNASLIYRKWQAFLGGSYEMERNLWTALMFVAWLDAVDQSRPVGLN
jgi:asparagine synthase (glutamine-hydrolysing)